MSTHDGGTRNLLPKRQEARVPRPIHLCSASWRSTIAVSGDFKKGGQGFHAGFRGRLVQVRVGEYRTVRIDISTPALTRPPDTILGNDRNNFLNIFERRINIPTEGLIERKLAGKSTVKWEHTIVERAFGITSLVASKTTPKVPPPPPRRAQKRSLFWHALAIRSLPSGVTTRN